MNILLYLIILPIIAGFLCLLVPQKIKRIVEEISLIFSLIIFALTILLFFQKPLAWFYRENLLLQLDNLSSFILIAIGLFGFLISLYSIKYMEGTGRLREYYAYILWTIGASCGVVLANNLILLLIFWGFLGLTLYLLIGINGPNASNAAKKTFIIVGGSDSLMLLGILLIWLRVSPQMSIFSLSMDRINIPLFGGVAIVAYFCLAIAAFTKAGAMPFHTWIPDMAHVSLVSVTAFLPASLDKLLGIYLLVRISTSLFIMNYAMNLILLIVGSITIIAAVMMAMIQSNLKKLLAYSTISQVGYMVIGIGTGNPIGIAGGLFHMLNHTIYKSCLFLCGGAVEQRAKTANLNKLGGLALFMPITFITFLIAAFSISGVPPFNGFFSKWMIYQGIIELGKNGDKMWIIWLVAAMFGSALTLAYFMKLIHAIFLGETSERIKKIEIKKDVHWTMWLPMVVLSGLCIIFGVFAYPTALSKFIIPSVSDFSFTGFWQPGLATLLIIIGIIIGLIIYLIGRVKGVREATPFIGGEAIHEESRVTGVDFYQTIQEMSLFKGIYKKAEEKVFDIYDQGRNLIFFFIEGLKKSHTGILTTYLVWIFTGLIILLLVVK